MTKDREEIQKEEAPDFEQLYYKAMQEIQVLKGDKISIEFSKDDVSLVRELLYEELYDLRDRASFVTDDDFEDEDEKAEAAMLKKTPKIDKDVVLHKMMDDRKLRIESLINQLNLE